MRYIILLMLIIAACDDSSSNKESIESATTRAESSSDGSDTETTKPEPDPPQTVQTWTEEFMTLVNNHRISIGAKPLEHVDGLGDIAFYHSEDMAQGDVSFGHDGFSNRCSEGRIVLGGGNGCAENVAKGQKSPLAAFTSWMNSSGHRNNIENARYTHSGFGYARSASGTYYWTQIFLEAK